MSTATYHAPTNTLCFDACPPPDPDEKRELKSCENCPAWFARKSFSGQKYCANCVARMLLPPTERELELTRELPGNQIHYDDSMLPNRVRRATTQQRVDRVVALFLSKERVTALEIKEASGYAGEPGACVGSLRSLGLKIKLAGYMPRHNGAKSPGYFILDGVAKIERAKGEDDPRWMSDEEVEQAIRRQLG